MNIQIINLEFGLPTVEQAHIRLQEAFRQGRSQNHKVLKLIHGYGSSGKGGAIKKSVHQLLQEEQAKGKIKLYVPGEEFSPFFPSTQQLLKLEPKIYKDRDYSRDNHGITWVVL